mmetsp:Transcript_21151/g.59037  ORF Transcript_21151/g.59037 Transcript_21151/m.59037 type:complete len:260 (+) Transcript_21151:156-935(+)
MVGTSSGLGGFMSGASIRFSKMKSGTGGADAWRDGLAKAYQSGGDAKRPRTSGMQLPKVNSIHIATVVCTKEFGAFCQLGDGDTFKDGMLHVSHMGETRFECPEDAGLKVGTKIWVKVTEVKDDAMKYSLDMRYVDQKDGKDLDPYQTKGRLPDNRWQGAKPKLAAPALAATSATSALTGDSFKAAASGVKRRDLEEMVGSEDDEESSEDSDEREKVSKKLKKAKKKLEKARKKAEKVKKKLANKGKKDKKEKAGSGSS